MRVRAALLPILLTSLLALPGCAGGNLALHSPPRSPNHRALRACTNGSVPVPGEHWWLCLDDTELSALVGHALETAPVALTSAQASLSAAIATRYIALRAQQTELVLLAAREDLDGRMVGVGRQRFAIGDLPRHTVAARLADTRADQAHTRAEIDALRVGLAVLGGSALDTLDRMPGGPIPLPPAANDPVILAHGADKSALERYGTARAAAARAQAEAISACAVAATQTMRARAAGTVAAGEALAADRRAIDALRGEEQARAVMAQAYVALAVSRAPRLDALKK